MHRRPVGQEHGFVALTAIGLEIAATRFAVVDAKSRLALGVEADQPIRLGFAERAVGATEPPLGFAAAAREIPAPAGIGAVRQPFPEGLLKTGDVVRVQIDGIGELSNTVVEEPEGYLAPETEVEAAWAR